MKSHMESVRIKDVWQCLLKNKQTKKPHKNPVKHPGEKDQALTCAKVKTEQSQGCEVRDWGLFYILALICIFFVPNLEVIKQFYLKCTILII